MYGSIERIPYGGYYFKLADIKSKYYGYSRRDAERAFRAEHGLRYKHIFWCEW